jgi:hypothetical protein
MVSPQEQIVPEAHLIVHTMVPTVVMPPWALPKAGSLSVRSVSLLSLSTRFLFFMVSLLWIWSDLPTRATLLL